MRTLKGLALIMALAAGLSSISFAAFSRQSISYFTGSALTGTGTMSMTATLSNGGSTLTWTGVVPGTTLWQAATNYINLAYNVSAGGGVQIYTDNMNINGGATVLVSTAAVSPAGLVNTKAGNNFQTLPMCWRVVQAATSTFITQSAANNLYDLHLSTGFFCYIWMLDKATGPGGSSFATVGGVAPWAGQVGGFSNEGEYQDVVDSEYGAQIGAMTTGIYLNSPVIVYVGANFVNAIGGTTYTGNIVLECFNE